MMQCFLICKSMYILIVHSIHYASRKKHKSLKIPFGQNKRYKNDLFLLLQAPNHHSFTYNFRFLYKLKRKVFLSKSVRGIFHFQFSFVFIKVYIFVQQNA